MASKRTKIDDVFLVSRKSIECDEAMFRWLKSWHASTSRALESGDIKLVTKLNNMAAFILDDYCKNFSDRMRHLGYRRSKTFSDKMRSIGHP